MVDKAICPFCDQEFEVTDYGYRVLCPSCGKLLDIFPEDQYFVDTPWGMIGIAMPEYKFWMKPVLTWMMKKAAEGKEKLKGMKK